MPNIRSQRIDANGIEIVASDGRTFSVTRAQIRNFFQAQTGTRAEKRAATIDRLKDEIRDALGANQINRASLSLDFDDADGTPTALEVGA